MGWSSLRVVFSQTRNFMVIAFTDAIFTENEGLVQISYAQPAGRMRPSRRFLRPSLGFRCNK